ncbi:MAG: N-acetylmuramoyl-L-alanine amidase [Gemmatimonadaceae bacterium]|nr:N-acetylmuramoyl-L-alanine amidase [Gemmatimonadaceae bacterium]
MIRSARLRSFASAPLTALLPAAVSATAISPNANERPPEVSGIACVVLHATADEGNERGAESWMRDSRSQVSAHLHVRRDGTVVRLVDDRRRAWHAGASLWHGMTDVNDFSLGWEIANRNDGREPYTDAQYDALVELAASYVGQGVPLESFVSHASVAIPLGRKRDPAGFNWIRFRTGVLARLEHQHLGGLTT